MMSQYSQIESTPGAGGYASSLNTESTQSAKKVEHQPMYPVTVKQISKANSSLDTKFLIDGANVYNVKLVGMVYDVSERNSDVTFVIDDGTGRIACTRWISDAHDTKEAGYLKNDVYFRVHGSLKTLSNGKTLLAVYAIRPVKDHNEIASHFLECIHSHCYNVKLQMQSNGSVTKSATTVINTPVGSQAIFSSQVVFNTEGLGDIEKMILEYLLQPSSTKQEGGVHMDEIAQKLALSKEKLTEVLSYLENEGLVYTAADEFHYKHSESKL